MKYSQIAEIIKEDLLKGVSVDNHYFDDWYSLYDASDDNQRGLNRRLLRNFLCKKGVPERFGLRIIDTHTGSGAHFFVTDESKK